jgi:hypothetical protein
VEKRSEERSLRHAKSGYLFEKALFDRHMWSTGADRQSALSVGKTMRLKNAILAREYHYENSLT